MPEQLIATRRLRVLTLDPADHPREMPHLSAGSGLVCAHGRAYVMADDEHHLAVFSDNHSRGRLYRVRSGHLPAGVEERKRLKPDFESMLLLPAQGRRPAALLALGSGSKRKRRAAVLIPLRADGEPDGSHEPVDLAPLHKALRDRLGAVNIEGTFLCGDEWVLLHRGVGGQPSASLRYPLAALQALVSGKAASLQPTAVQSHDLGFIDGVQLAFTDGAALPDGRDGGDGGFLFSAVAEATANSVDDGACKGSVIGHVDGNGALLALRRLTGRAKVEGLALHAAGATLDLAMVTDADDPTRPSELLLARW